MNQFIADVGALNGWQGMVDEVSGQVSSFKGSFAGPSDLASSHGAIGFPMQNAFDGASSARAGALGATQVAAGRMAQLLGEASPAYQRGDVAAGDRLRAQAEAIEGAGSPASAAAPQTRRARPVVELDRWSGNSASWPGRWRSPSPSRCKASPKP